MNVKDIKDKFPQFQNYSYNSLCAAVMRFKQGIAKQEIDRKAANYECNYCFVFIVFLKFIAF